MQNDNLNHNDHNINKENLQESTIDPSLTTRTFRFHEFNFKGETYRWVWNVEKKQAELWKQNDTMHNFCRNANGELTATSGDGRPPTYTVDLNSLTKDCTREEAKMLHDTKDEFMRKVKDPDYTVSLENPEIELGSLATNLLETPMVMGGKITLGKNPQYAVEVDLEITTHLIKPDEVRLSKNHWTRILKLVENLEEEIQYVNQQFRECSKRSQPMKKKPLWIQNED